MLLLPLPPLPECRRDLQACCLSKRTSAPCFADGLLGILQNAKIGDTFSVDSGCKSERQRKKGEKEKCMCVQRASLHDLITFYSTSVKKRGNGCTPRPFTPLTAWTSFVPVLSDDWCQICVCVCVRVFVLLLLLCTIPRILVYSRQEVAHHRTKSLCCPGKDNLREGCVHSGQGTCPFPP